MAQSESAARNFSIPAGSLSGALQAYSAQTGVQLVYSSDLVSGLNSPGVSGRMTASEALTRLLSGTGLSGTLSGNTATISAGGSADPEQVAGVVNVQGVQGSLAFGGAGQAAGVNGINGSRDITATEGTGSFNSGALTIGGRVPLAPLDIPQSVSVLTAERFEQQNITDFTSAMRQLPGVTLIQGDSSLRNIFYSRGFEISSVQIDGGAPMTVTGGRNYQPLIDMATYDHVELLRGAEGLYNGYGNPGGSINLSRKKPLDHGQVLFEVQGGSWNNYRTIIDIASPLGFDGKLRGRAVVSYQDRDFFYDIARSSHTTFYAVVDADVTPNTLVTAGFSYTKQDERPWNSGLPRYESGASLDLPRSTCLCFTWGKQNFETTEFFGQVDQDFGERWHASLRATRITQKNDYRMGDTIGPVNDETLTGHTLYNAAMVDYGSEQTMLDFNLNGTFMLFGHEQQVVVGANWQKSDDGDTMLYGSLFSEYPGPNVDVFDWDPVEDFGDQIPSARIPISKREQLAAFANFILTPVERLHLTVGLRYSKYRSHFIFQNLCMDIFSLPEEGFECANLGDVYSFNDWKFDDSQFSQPTYTLTYDISDRLKVHGTYSRIYQTQADYLTVDFEPLPPLSGMNLELGLKYVTPDNRLNVSLAAYTIQQNNFPVYDTSKPAPPGLNCCYRAGNQKSQSRGFDFEVTGELLRGFDVSLGYTFNDNEYKGSDAYSAGEPVVTRQPKHLLKLWTTYRFERGDWMNGLTLSIGVNAQTKTYVSGSACVDYDQAPPNQCIEYAPFDFTQSAYALVSARVELPLSRNLNVSVNLNNLTDLTYYQTTGSSSGGNWYGEPRSVMFAVRGKW